MLILASAGIPLPLLGLLTADPPRGVGASEDSATPSLLVFVRDRPWAVLRFVGAAGGLAIAVQAATTMAAMGLMRRFSAPIDGLGQALGATTLVTSLGSLPLAGLLDRVFTGRIGPPARPASMALSAAIALPLAWLLAVSANLSSALALNAAFLLATGIGNALIPTMLQDLAPVRLRARCFAAYSFVIATFCAAGPLLSGAVSDRMTHGDLLLAIGLVAVPALAVTMLLAGTTVLLRER